MIQHLTAYVLTGFIVAILLPWACMETALLLSRLKTKPSPPRRTYWLLAVLLVGSLTIAGCAGGSKDGAGDIVAPKGASGAGVTRTESEGLENLGGTTAGGGSAGGSTGPSLEETPPDEGMSPALIMQVVNTILN